MAPTLENVCSVLAVARQESIIRRNPAVRCWQDRLARD
ncbi:hypothetical protein ACLK19_02630 [Escherichia coli]